MGLGAFLLHHLSKAVIGRHEHEGEPAEIFHSQARLGDSMMGGCDEDQAFVE